MAETKLRKTCVCIPPEGTADRTEHLLSAYGEEPMIWVWFNGGWSTRDNLRWGTKPGPMHTLGWRYVGRALTQPETPDHG